MNHANHDMSCSEAQDLMSAFYDGELPDDLRSRVSKHLDHCSACAKELAGFESLTAVVGALSEPSAPPEIWSQLEAELDGQRATHTSAPVDVPQQRGWMPLGRFAVAAIVLVVVGLGWAAHRTWFGHGDHGQFATEFGHYLEEFHRDPDAAQQLLLGKYEHQLVLPERVIDRVGYEPAVASGVPDEYELVSTHVMKMPCCTCVQSICKRSDGTVLAIFEHDDEETTEWFGDRPEVEVRCEEQMCMLVELDEQVAATWKRGTRHITLIGVRDVSEITQMVSWLDEKDSLPN